MSDSGEPIPGANPRPEKREAQLGATRLVELERKTPGLGGFIRLLDSSNRVRQGVEDGSLNNLSSRRAFDSIWQTHAGITPEDQALAFTEGGGIPVDEWTEALSRNKRPTGILNSIRLIPGQPPMLFDLPSALKPQVTELFFQLADQMLTQPNRLEPAYMPAVVLQTHLNFIHPKIDGNGRTTEDWMLWWQKHLVATSTKLVQSNNKTDQSDPLASFLGTISVPAVAESTIRSWFHHGLRYKYGNNEDPLRTPEFLKDEYKEKYVSGRETMLARTIAMNIFRRDMYVFLTQGLGYQGDPNKFEDFLKLNEDKAIDLFNNLYANNSSLVSIETQTFNADLYPQLAQTGAYSYTNLEPKDVIKPEYLPPEASELATSK